MPSPLRLHSKKWHSRNLPRAWRYAPFKHASGNEISDEKIGSLDLADIIFGAEMVSGRYPDAVHDLSRLPASQPLAASARPSPGSLSDVGSQPSALNCCCCCCVSYHIRSVVRWWLKFPTRNWPFSVGGVDNILRRGRERWRGRNLAFASRRTASDLRAPSTVLASCTRASTKTRALCRASGAPRTSSTSWDSHRTIFVSITKVAGLVLLRSCV